MKIFIKELLFLCLALLSCISMFAQSSEKKNYTKADTLRGSITAERAWWDVLRYDISFAPDYNNKTISGSNTISYKVVKKIHPSLMQIDLKDPLVIDSIIQDNQKLKFVRSGSVWYVTVGKKKKSNTNQLQIFYHGKVHEAIRAPWDGGFTFTKDSLGRPWMTVTCQGATGASIWYPCKDHQSDEPDNGASLTITVPDTLVAIANGRLQFKKNNNDGTATYKWAVVNPISNYCIIPYIGKYVNFNEKYNGEKGMLDVNYWVLDYNTDVARQYMPDQVHKMLKSFEYWFGPYPFYEDGYQLIETSHTGMEHQSAVSYGNHYKFGYRGRDVCDCGWGLKFDFIIIHESGHEWFGNNITSNDLADMWLHEGFTNYSETLFTDYNFGKEAGNQYNFGIRKGIKNDRPIIPDYDVNAQGSGDMYSKAGNMLHSIRHSITNDEAFRQILRGLNKTFYHQTVSTQQVENYISKKAGFDYSKVFDQYLRTIQIPAFEFYFTGDKDKLFYRYSNCVDGFNLPISLSDDKASVKITPSVDWQSIKLSQDEAGLFSTNNIEKIYYVNPKLINK